MAASSGGRHGSGGERGAPNPERHKNAKLPVNAKMKAVSTDIHFYNEDKPYGCFSNFYRADILIDGKKWPTTEHYFQAMKFVDDPALVERIRIAATPGEAARLGRNRNFPLRKDWHQEVVCPGGKTTRVKVEIMRRALRAKFDQHPDLKQQLLATRGRNLIERTAKDNYWGDGGDGSGRNMLGKLLVELRFILLREEEEKEKECRSCSCC